MHSVQVLRWARLVPLSFALSAAMAACVPGQTPLRVGEIPSGPLGRLSTSEELTFAVEVEPVCALSQGTGKTMPTAWTPLEANQLAGQSFAVVERKFVDDGDKPWVALRLKSSNSDEELWLRNVGAKDPAEAAQQWRCAVDSKTLAKHLPKQTAKIVRLDTSSAGCSELTPILGSSADVGFGPYDVVDVGVFAAAPKDGSKGKAKHSSTVVAVRLEAEGGARMLTVASATFDRCFVPATRPAPPLGEVKALADWLERDPVDPAAMPPISAETFELAGGVDPSFCANVGGRLECRAPIVHPSIGPNGPFGPSVIELIRDRAVDAVFVGGGKAIVPPEPSAFVGAVRTSKVAPGSAFGKALAEALRVGAADAKRKSLRASLGYRWSREAGGATHLVDVDVSYKVPDVVTTTEPHVHRYLGAVKPVESPAWTRAKLAFDEAEQRVKSATLEVALASHSHRLAFGREEAAPMPKGAAEAAANRLAVAKAVRKTAKATLDETPKQIERAEEKSYTFTSKTLTRAGEATVRISIAPAKGASTPTVLTTTVPFSVSDFETNYTPEHQLKGRKALPPTAEDAEKAIAEGVSRAVDRAITRFLAQKALGADPGDVAAATRPTTALLARHAAGDRHVKLVRDFVETRDNVLASERASYLVRLPDDAAGRCFSIVAATRDARRPLDLSFGRRVGKGMQLVARDRRPDGDAAIDLCKLAPGEYVAEVSWAKGEDHAPFALALYETTPGSQASDTLAAAKGTAPVPQKGEVVALDGSTLPKLADATSDTDGDGIPDATDKCPRDAETRNGYLDEDGCPDEAPPVVAKGPDGATDKPKDDKAEKAEKAAKEKAEKAEKAAKEKAEKEQAAKEKAEKAAKEKAEKEQAAKEKAEKEKAEKAEKAKKKKDDAAAAAVIPSIGGIAAAEPGAPGDVPGSTGKTASAAPPPAPPAPPPVAPAPPAPPPTPPSAAPPAPPPAAPPPAAPPPAAPPPAAPPPVPPAPPPSAAPPAPPPGVGTLVIVTDAKAVCLVDEGANGHGPTPLILKAPAGAHTVVCTVEENGVAQKRTATVNVTAGKAAKVSLGFKQ